MAVTSGSAVKGLALDLRSMALVQLTAVSPPPPPSLSYHVYIVYYNCLAYKRLILGGWWSGG